MQDLWMAEDQKGWLGLILDKIPIDNVNQHHSLSKKGKWDHRLAMTDCCRYCRNISMCKDDGDPGYEPIYRDCELSSWWEVAWIAHWPVGTLSKTKMFEESDMPLTGWKLLGRRNAKPYLSEASLRYRTNLSEFPSRVISSETNIGAGVDSRKCTSSSEGM